MELKDIVSVAGISGLHKIIGKTKTGLIVETIGTGKRFPTSVQDKVSVLEDIAMYTESGDMKLAEVLVKINGLEKGGTTVPDAKAESKEQRSFVTDAIKLDNERVYDSDVKKLLTWYHVLKTELDFSTLVKEEEKAAPEEAEATAETEEKVKTKKAAAPKAPKNAAPKNVSAKANSKGAGGAKTTYRPKSV